MPTTPLNLFAFHGDVLLFDRKKGNAAPRIFMRHNPIRFALDIPF
jgi:hypothetical protein